MHWQAAPFEEAKLVRVTRGSIFDVIVDIRPSSNTFRHWFGVELSAENMRQIYIPEGFAHGFMTLANETEVLYEMTAVYNAEAARGFAWNDPGINIGWPEPRAIEISPSRCCIGSVFAGLAINKAISICFADIVRTNHWPNWSI